MAAGATYTPIATTTLGSAAAYYTFSSISGSYTDLILVLNGTGDVQDVRIQFNGDTATNYSTTILKANGTVASSTRETSVDSILCDYVGYNSSTISNHITQIQNYSNTTTYKTVIGRANNSSSGTDAIVGVWRSTAAITSIKVLVAGATFFTGYTFTLYGIAAA